MAPSRGPLATRLVVCGGVLRGLLQNVAITLVCSGLALTCCALGNVTSRRSLAQQTYLDALAATMFWINVFFCVIIQFIQTSLLRTKHFLSRPQRRAGFVTALRRVVRATYPLMALHIGSMVALVYVVDAITKRSVRSWRLELHINCFAGIAYIALVWIATRKIYLQETVEGTARRSVQTQAQSQQSASSRGPSPGMLPVGPSARRAPPIQRRKLRWHRRLWLQWRTFVRVFIRAVPSGASMAFAGLYVQLTSLRPIKTQRDLVVFATTSIIVKLVVQEVIKLLMRRRHVRDIRTLFLSVGLPTILIDTQVRLMLQLVDGATFTVGGSVAMAVVEIVTRLGKVLAVRYQLRRTTPLPAAPALKQPVVPMDRQRAHNRVRAASIVAARASSGLDPVDERRQIVFRFHAAELYADMAAEYIAIALSSMFVLAFGQHPRFELTSRRENASSGDAGGATYDTTSVAHLLRVIAFQTAMELVVDLLSCLLEVSQGVDFDELRKYAAYITITFIGLGVMNVHVTSVVYMKPDQTLSPQI
ncbi:hypothetical protein ATCC90586_003353 [Pythium insidiosum]|nr:hypothetical protein ATCC90586_003353 [Pythium insidiosum]